MEGYEVTRKIQMEEHVLRDQEMSNNDGSLTWRRKSIAKVQPKTLVFKEEDKFGQAFKFEKTSSGASNKFLEIKLEWEKIVSERCNLGHQHERSEGKENRIFSLDWHHVDSLIEWLQKGSWSPKIKKQKLPTHVRLLRDALEMLDQIKITEAHSSDRRKMSNLKARIKNHLGEGGWQDIRSKPVSTLKNGVEADDDFDFLFDGEDE